jgi:hypothetical protein
MNCVVCGCPLYGGRTVFQCSCGVITHAQCWEKHVVESHKPAFTLGIITMDGEFSPRDTETEQDQESIDKETVSLGSEPRAK